MAGKPKYNLCEQQVRRSLENDVRHTVATLAQEFGVSEESMRRFMGKHGMQTARMLGVIQPFWTPTNDGKLRQLAAQGLSNNEIGKEFGVSGYIVAYRIEALGIGRPVEARRVKTDAKKVEILRVYNAGASATVTAAQLGVSKGTVCGVIHRARKAGEFVRPADEVTKQAGYSRPPRGPRPQHRRKPVVMIGAKAQDVPRPTQKKAPVMRTFDNVIPFEELGRGRCKFPVSKHVNDRPPYMFCGKPAAEGQPYCAECFLACHEPLPAKKARRNGSAFMLRASGAR